MTVRHIEKWKEKKGQIILGKSGATKWLWGIFFFFAAPPQSRVNETRQVRYI